MPMPGPMASLKAMPAPSAAAMFFAPAALNWPAASPAAAKAGASMVWVSWIVRGWGDLGEMSQFGDGAA